MNNSQRQQRAEMLTSATFTNQLVGAPFKTVFKATCGFYLAQLAMGLITLTGLALVILIIGFVTK